jgi:hypothetical protein
MPTRPLDPKTTSGKRSSLALPIALGVGVLAAVGFMLWKRSMQTPDDSAITAPATTPTPQR